MVKEKDKNLKSSLSEYQRYIRGEMSKREENSFLRKFQDDPFAEKATVSFSGISPLEAVDDKDTPGKLFKKWFNSRKRVVFFSAGVLVAALMIISSIFIILDKNKSAKQLNKDNVKPVPSEVTDSNHITGLIQVESKSISDSMGIKVNHETTSHKIDTAISAGTNNPAITENTKAPALIAGKDSTPNTEKDQISTPTMESKEYQATTEAEMHTKLDHSTEASKKIVSTEFGISGKSDNKQPGYISPQPFNGISNFNLYIEENIIKPLTNTPGADSVVVISFMVLTTGTVDSIKVINSPGDEFTKKAIKLIREGPSWKPAENNGQTIDDEVKIRIVFK